MTWVASFSGAAATNDIYLGKQQCLQLKKFGFEYFPPGSIYHKIRPKVLPAGLLLY